MRTRLPKPTKVVSRATPVAAAELCTHIGTASSATTSPNVRDRLTPTAGAYCSWKLSMPSLDTTSEAESGIPPF